MKHKPEVDLESLDFEAMDKEMEANVANVVKGVVPEVNADEGAGAGQDGPATWTSCKILLSLSLSLSFGALLVLGLYSFSFEHYLTCVFFFFFLNIIFHTFGKLF